MNWEAIGVIIAGIGGLLAIAVAYLRLFVKNELQTLESHLKKTIEDSYVRRDLFEIRSRGLEERLQRIEHHAA